MKKLSLESLKKNKLTKKSLRTVYGGHATQPKSKEEYGGAVTSTYDIAKGVA